MAAALLASIGTALTVAEQETVTSMSSDLQFLLSEHEVSARIQLVLAAHGYKSITTFSVWADDRAGVRAAITRTVIDPAEVGLTAVQVSAATLIVNQLLSAWILAGRRVEEEVRVSADARLLRLPPLLSRVSLISLRQRYETENGRCSDLVYPCASMLEKRLEEIEEGSLTAQALSDVISVDLAGDEHAVISEVGVSVKVRKQPKAIALPSSTEDLRQRFKTLAISFVLAGYKHSTRVWLRSATLETFRNYVEHLLGEEVAAFHLDQDGLAVRASWTTVLNYDLAMRKLATRLVLYDGDDFQTALVRATKDLACRERYFITPTAMLAATAGKPKQTQVDAGGKGNKGKQGVERTIVKQKGQKGQGGKGAGKGGKGKKGSKITTPIKKTPDGRSICGYHNTTAGCNLGASCRFVHICNVCFSPEHTGLNCTVTTPI